MKRLGINLGYVTNSSSMVFWFPREILEDPEIKAFVEAFELGKGWVGGNLLSRSGNPSFIVTREQREEAREQLVGYYDESVQDGWGPINIPNIDPDNEDVIVIYGDEYSTTAHTLGNLLVEACRKNNLVYREEDMH